MYYNKPNPAIDFENSPFYVNSKLSEWKTNGNPRRAGVSSFGVGGTNVHVVLEEAPEQENSSLARSKNLILLSAKTQTALDSAVENLKKYLENLGENVRQDEVSYVLYPLEYDANGNNSSNITNQFTWDNDNRMTQDYNTVTRQTTNYTYDLGGQRVSKTVGASTTNYFSRYVETGASGT